MDFEDMVRERRNAAAKEMERLVREAAEAIALVTMPIKPHADAVAGAIWQSRASASFQRTFGRANWTRGHRDEPPAVTFSTPTTASTCGCEVTLSLGVDGVEIWVEIRQPAQGGITKEKFLAGPVAVPKPEDAARFLLVSLAEFAASLPEPEAANTGYQTYEWPDEGDLNDPEDPENFPENFGSKPDPKAIGRDLRVIAAIGVAVIILVAISGCALVSAL